MLLIFKRETMNTLQTFLQTQYIIIDDINHEFMFRKSLFKSYITNNNSQKYRCVNRAFL